MAYSTNPNLPKARATAMRLALAIVARKCGYKTTISERLFVHRYRP